MINQSDKHILRELARRVAEIAAEPVQEERRQLWKKINSLEPCRIPFVLSLGGTPIKYEYVPESELTTTDPVAKSYEHELRMKIWRWENIDDDYVTEPVIHYDIEVRLPGLVAPRKNHPYGDELHAYHVEPVIEKESDIDKIVEESGGQVDWYSVDADAPLAAPGVPPSATEVIPNRMRYLGAPHPRWWQIEDAAVVA